jgi:hypothetical protein
MKTRRPLSPIELMIGKVVGISDQTVPVMVLMQCRECKQSKWVEADESWIEGTAKIEFDCKSCNPPNFVKLYFMDRTGEVLEVLTY